MVLDAATSADSATPARRKAFATRVGVTRGAMRLDVVTGAAPAVTDAFRPVEAIDEMADVRFTSVDWRRVARLLRTAVGIPSAPHRRFVAAKPTRCPPRGGLI
jgi:hypothetical protein